MCSAKNGNKLVVQDGMMIMYSIWYMFLFRLKFWMLQHLYNCEQTTFQDEVDDEDDSNCKLFSETSDVSEKIEGWVCERAA